MLAIVFKPLIGSSAFKLKLFIGDLLTTQETIIHVFKITWKWRICPDAFVLIRHFIRLVLSPRIITRNSKAVKAR